MVSEHKATFMLACCFRVCARDISVSFVRMQLVYR